MTTYYTITGVLKARTAVHIGAGTGNDTTDALIRRDGSGRPFIPGTAIAGALRGMLTRLAPCLGMQVCKALKGDKINTCTCEVCHLFGNLNPKDEPANRAEASRLLVFDAIAQDNIPGIIRDGVGINRTSGVAARVGAVKFDLEVLPRGTTFGLRLELRNANEQDKRLLAAALSEWKEERAWLGGNVARGLGAFKLEGLQCARQDLNQVDQLIAFLGSDTPWENAQKVPDWLGERVKEITNTPPNAVGESCCWIHAEFTLQAEGPLLTNDTATADISGFDHAPLVVSVKDWAQPTLTGASLRGVLRSHAERIARTLATLEASHETEFLQKCPACDPLVKRSQKEPQPALESCDSLLKGKVPATADVSKDQLCLACRLFGSTRWGSRLVVEDACFVGDQPRYKMLDFLAIDRFTGGGAEHFKFDALALWQPAFRVRLYLDNPELWEVGWLTLVLRDLREGWLNVGFGTSKGFGRVRIPDSDWKLRLGFLDSNRFGLSATTNSGIYQVAEFNPATQSLWLEQAKQWVKAFNDQIKTFQRPDYLHLPKDSYFGKVDHLYLKEVIL
jgi:CRISPR/Cas system CSM-associated protein Csm3 (group 7 of RAMP superfamily)